MASNTGMVTNTLILAPGAYPVSATIPDTNLVIANALGLYGTLESLTGDFVEYSAPGAEDIIFVRAKNPIGKQAENRELPTQSGKSELVNGTVLVFGRDKNGSRTSLTPEQIATYSEKFREPALVNNPFYRDFLKDTGHDQIQENTARVEAKFGWQSPYAAMTRKLPKQERQSVSDLKAHAKLSAMDRNAARHMGVSYGEYKQMQKEGTLPKAETPNAEKAPRVKSKEASL